MNRLALLSLIPLLAVGCSTHKADTGGGGSASTQGAPGAQTVTVNMTDALEFTPATIAAKVGTVTVKVANTGAIPHNLHFDQGSLGKTGTVDGKSAEDLKVVFDKAGTFTFVCTFHSGMTGKVVVS